MTLWHPYTQHGLQTPILPVVSARGAYLRLKDGRELLDAISSWWVNLHGHGHPELVAAIAGQAACLDHVLFAGFTHAPAIELADTLVSAAKARKLALERVFYSDNGSTAVEVALKMAFQCQLNRGMPKRTRFVALRGSFHGDTLGAMAVGGSEGFHAPFRKLLPEADFVAPDDLSELESLIARKDGKIAAFIFEPLVQGAAGMRMHGAEYLKAAIELCRRNGILTIADEVFTGFYRTGKCFAMEHVGDSPDLLCLSKGITGGVLPLAVTLASKPVFDSFLSTSLRSAFLHGHSYTANPIACAAALASWKLLQTPACQRRIEEIALGTSQSIARLRLHPRVSSARCLGTIGAVEIKGDGDYFSTLAPQLLSGAMERGVLLRPLGRVLYGVPPYCCTPVEIRKIYEVMEELADAV